MADATDQELVEGSSLSEFIQVVVDTVSQLPGLLYTPIRPPEQLNLFPALLVYSNSGSYKLGTHSGGDTKEGSYTGQHIVRVEIHVERRNLPDDLARVRHFGDKVADALVSRHYRDQFDGLVARFVELRYTFQPLDWGDSETIGWRFNLEVVLHEEVNNGSPE